MKPRLAAVNFFLGIVGVIQVSRIVAYNYGNKGESATAQLEGAKEDIVDNAEGLKKDAIAAVKS
jgi:mitochondrial pyruvate carrier 2